MKTRKERLLELFPEANVGGSIDWEALIHLVEQTVLEHKSSPPIPKYQRDFLIRSENKLALEGLQKNYLEQFDVLYIDPPYNTGRAFTYHDRRGGGWLSWMRARMKLVQPLLSEDAVIFVSIGDDEVHRMRALLEEIFGKKNYIGTLVWVKKKKGSHLSSTLRNITEFVLCCSVNKKKTDLYGEKAYAVKAQPLSKKINSRKLLSFAKGSLETTLKDGLYERPKHPHLIFSAPFAVKGGVVQTALRIEGPFVWVQSKLDEELGLGSRVVLSSKFGLNVYRHNQASKYKRPLTLINASVGVGTYEDAHADLAKDLGGEFLFSYSKPVSLMIYLLRAATHHKPTSRILDFFAGSGSTGRGVQELNRLDGGTRTFCLIQQEEEYKGERFSSIADVTQFRLEKHAKVPIGICSWKEGRWMFESSDVEKISKTRS